jgi:hypothetical protein
MSLIHFAYGTIALYGVSFQRLQLYIRFLTHWNSCKCSYRSYNTHRPTLARLAAGMV